MSDGRLNLERMRTELIEEIERHDNYKRNRSCTIDTDGVLSLVYWAPSGGIKYRFAVTDHGSVRHQETTHDNPWTDSGDLSVRGFRFWHGQVHRRIKQYHRAKSHITGLHWTLQSGLIVPRDGHDGIELANGWVLAPSATNAAERTAPR